MPFAHPIARMFFKLKGQLVLDFRVRIGLILGPICAIAFERICTYFLSYAKVFLVVYIYSCHMRFFPQRYLSEQQKGLIDLLSTHNWHATNE